MFTITVPPSPDEDPQPHYDDYPTTRDYEQAFYLWRARRRDARLNPEEMAAQWQVLDAALSNRLGSR